MVRGTLVPLLALALGCGSAPPAARHPVAQTAALCGKEPLPLAFGSTLISSTELGTSRNEASCVRAPAPECLYVLDVPSRAQLRVALLSAEFDGALALLDAAGISELACVDDRPLGDTHHTRLEVTLDPGQYLLVVDGSGGAAGSFELFAELDLLPSVEQVCRAPEPLHNGQYTRGSTRGGIGLLSPRCAGGAPGPEQAHAFTLAERARVRLREHSEFDAVLSVRAACSDAASELACSGAGADGHAQLTAELPAGTYTALIDGYARADSGDYVLAFEQQPVPAPRMPEQACQAARPLPLDGSRVEVDTFYLPATLSGSCGGEDAPEALFNVSVAKRGSLELTLSDRELDPVVYLRKSCSGNDDELLCLAVPAARAESDAAKVLSLQLEPGSYLLGIDGLQPFDMGALTLRATFRPATSAPRAP